MASSRSLPSTTVQMVPSGSRWWSRWAWPKRKTVTQLSLGVRSLSFHTLYEVPSCLLHGLVHQDARGGPSAEEVVAEVEDASEAQVSELVLEHHGRHHAIADAEAAELLDRLHASLLLAELVARLALARALAVGGGERAHGDDRSGGANNRVFRLGRDDRGGRANEIGRTRDSQDPAGSFRTGCGYRRAPRARSPRDAVCARATRDSATTVQRVLKSQSNWSALLAPTSVGLLCFQSPNSPAFARACGHSS